MLEIQCEYCDGKGEISYMSAGDNADFDVCDCEECSGDGWVYATPWTGSP